MPSDALLDRVGAGRSGALAAVRFLAAPVVAVTLRSSVQVRVNPVVQVLVEHLDVLEVVALLLGHKGESFLDDGPVETAFFEMLNDFGLPLLGDAAVQGGPHVERHHDAAQGALLSALPVPGGPLDLGLMRPVLRAVLLIANAVRWHSLFEWSNHLVDHTSSVFVQPPKIEVALGQLAQLGERGLSWPELGPGLRLALLELFGRTPELVPKLLDLVAHQDRADVHAGGLLCIGLSVTCVGASTFKAGTAGQHPDVLAPTAVGARAMDALLLALRVAGALLRQLFGAEDRRLDRPAALDVCFQTAHV